MAMTLVAMTLLPKRVSLDSGRVALTAVGVGSHRVARAYKRCSCATLSNAFINTMTLYNYHSLVLADKPTTVTLSLRLIKMSLPRDLHGRLQWFQCFRVRPHK